MLPATKQDIPNSALYKNRDWHIIYRQNGDYIKDSSNEYTETFQINYLTDNSIQIPAFSIAKPDTLIKQDMLGDSLVTFYKKGQFYDIGLRYYKNVDSAVISYYAIQINGGHKYDYYNVTAWAR